VPFGLQGLLSLLMHVMNEALTVWLGPSPAVRGCMPGASGPLGWCALVYMDDCLVHSLTLEQHLLDVAEVLEIFRLRKLFAKSSKYEFGLQELGFLGHRLSRAGVSVDPRKVQSIVEWATPTSCTEVLLFTGLANYYCQFVEGYAEIAAQLTALGSPTARFVWTPEAQGSFDALKQALSTLQVLCTFDQHHRVVLTTDASGVDVTHLPCLRNQADPLTRRGFADGLGPAASTGDQDPESQQELFSRLGRDAQCPAALATIRAGWAAHLRAAAVWFAGVQEGDDSPSARPQGGGASLPCTSMFVALAGSGVALETGTTVPSDDHFLAPAFVQSLVQELAVNTFFWPILRGPAATLGKPVDRHGTAILGASRAPLCGALVVLCGLLYRRGQGAMDRLCIPAGGGLRAQVLQECHDGQLGGHFGRAKTGSMVQRLAFWVWQDVEVAEYVCTCQTCQRTKTEHGGPRGLLHPLQLPSLRCGMIGVD
jgi:hypothetical protein